MNNFKYITQNPETLAEFLESLNIEQGEQAIWEEFQGESALRWLDEKY